MNHSLKRGLLFALAAATLPLASACNKAEDESPETTTAGDVDRTVAVALSDADGLTTFESAINSAKLSSVFDGQGSYTLLAPNDAAFEKLGEQGNALMQEDQRALLIAVLRDHILPGHLTPEAIEKAIADHGGPVTVSTLGDGTVTFTQQGDTIVVSNDGQARARFASNAMAATNGVVIPLDAVLLPPKPKETAS